MSVQRMFVCIDGFVSSVILRNIRAVSSRTNSEVVDLWQRYTFGEQWFGVARWMAVLGGAERGQLLTHIGGEM